MKNLLSVTIDNSPKILNYVINIDIEIGDKVVVESERGITIADVKKKISIDTESEEKHPEIIRIANNKDLVFQEAKKDLEYRAKQYCLERIVFRKMKMKIVDVKYMLHSSKVIFYFTADGRVDFRNIVKDLASKLKSRIEMRQIGVRDQAQIVGGIGVCGRELCCHSFMGDFAPISLDDARQSGSGNSDKLIGLCGRFMCCLKFEDNSEDCQECCHREPEVAEGIVNNTLINSVNNNKKGDVKNIKEKEKDGVKKHKKIDHKNKTNKNKFKGNKEVSE
jgi:cell fate regulator YaaT (PSP1 superfamily)